MQSLTFLQLYEHCKSKCNYASACVLQADMHRQVHPHAGMPCKFNHYMHACFARNCTEALWPWAWPFFRCPSHCHQHSWHYKCFRWNTGVRTLSPKPAFGLNCSYLLYYTRVCDMFHFLPSNPHFKSHHLLGVKKVTGTRLHNTLCTNACMEPKDTTSFIYGSRVSYIKLYKFTHT